MSGGVCWQSDVSLPKHHSGLYFLSKMRPANDRRFTQRTLEVIAGLLQYILPQSVNVQRILQARVPIVKFSHIATGIDCDITLENEYVIASCWQQKAASQLPPAE